MAFCSLKKCPRNDSKAARSWVASPLGVNVLLSLFKDRNGNLEHFTQIQEDFIHKPECFSKTKVFSKPNNEQLLLLKDKNSVENVDNLQNAVSFWVKHNYKCKELNLKNNIPKVTQLILLNICSFKSKWITPTEDAGAMMKIYNSFSYTQDVKYEARILELPMQDQEFKLVLIVPNEEDLLHTLFRRLANQGLKVALCNIQPIFPVYSKLMAPNIHFESIRFYQEEINKLGFVTISHFGNINVNDEGAYIQVLSFLYPDIPVTNSKAKLPNANPPFFFGLIFKETPIFIGQFNYNE